ncbi:membrane-associatingdomain-containing protein [Cordyceps javanica]|uniref:Membrane-associatingdomain-containing protein n=1 Tax=Cordyceps javanica TaxID=43265 RepID=A0A545V3M1_9HYPO|nr:membrane-associatingdomain-containing protein [Cordyceps javanica]
MAAPPALGALGLTFTVMRVMQFIGLVVIIGLSSSFVADIVASSYAAPPALIGTLVIACLAEVYVIISYILYWDSLLPLLIATAADLLCLVAGIVVACVVGKPVSYLDCEAFPGKGNTAVFLNSLFANVKRVEGNTFEWVAASKPSCLQLKAIWGISIAMCALFTLSTATAACLWRRLKCGGPRPPKDLE